MKCSACPNERLFARGLCQACYYRQRRNGTTERKNAINSGACSHPGCDRQAFSKNLCSAHYHRAKHPLWRTWSTVRSRASGAYPKAWDRFEGFLADVGERPSPQHQLRRKCQDKPWSKDNFKWLEPLGRGTQEEMRTYQWRWHLKNRYGITQADVDAMLAAQDGKCAGCLCDLATASKVCVDHDHITRKVRGLLCDPCNKSIGQLNDKSATLRRLADYLDHHQSVATAAAAE